MIGTQDLNPIEVKVVLSSNLAAFSDLRLRKVTVYSQFVRLKSKYCKVNKKVQQRILVSLGMDSKWAELGTQEQWSYQWNP